MGDSTRYMLIMGTSRVEEDEAGVWRHYPAQRYIQHLLRVATSASTENVTSRGLNCLTCQVQRSFRVLSGEEPRGWRHFNIPVSRHGVEEGSTGVSSCTASRSGVFTPIHLRLTPAFSLGNSPPSTS